MIIARCTCAHGIHYTAQRAPCVLHTCFCVCSHETLAHTLTDFVALSRLARTHVLTHYALVSSCRGSQRRIRRARASGRCFEGLRWHSASPSPAQCLLSRRACEREHSTTLNLHSFFSFSRTRAYGPPRNVMADPGKTLAPRAMRHHDVTYLHACLPQQH